MPVWKYSDDDAVVVDSESDEVESSDASPSSAENARRAPV